jgi:hypothetical protein
MMMMTMLKKYILWREKLISEHEIVTNIHSMRQRLIINSSKLSIAKFIFNDKFDTNSMKHSTSTTLSFTLHFNFDFIYMREMQNQFFVCCTLKCNWFRNFHSENIQNEHFQYWLKLNRILNFIISILSSEMKVNPEFSNGLYYNVLR